MTWIPMPAIAADAWFCLQRVLEVRTVHSSTILLILYDNFEHFYIHTSLFVYNLQYTDTKIIF